MQRSRSFPLWILLGLILASACAPAAPTDTGPAPQSITFTTSDDATVNGTLYGSGETAVIFSMMSDCERGWEDMAKLTAQNGVMALVYQWRACKAYGAMDEDEHQKFLEDTRGAINFAQAQGAKKIILAGASLGGCASAKLAVESQASGIIVLAASPSIPGMNFEIEPADLNTDIPKLFITAEHDFVHPIYETQQLYDMAAEPKEWQTYSGSALGTDLFESEHKEELQQRILDFILAIARQ